MKKTAIYDYFAFGYNYNLLRSNSAEWGRERLVDELQSYFRSLEELDTPVSLRVATKLRKLLHDLSESSDPNVGPEVYQDIAEELNKVDPALDAELQLKEAFVLTEKRFPLSSLTDEPQKLLADTVFAELSTSSQRDFSLGCLQIALNQPTSAAFHFMRALEEEVKGLYFAFKKTKRLQKPMWAAMIRELREKKPPKPALKALDHLDSIRVHFRNPTQHPDAFYTLDEAQDLLNQTITAINMIKREIACK